MIDASINVVIAAAGKAPAGGAAADATRPAQSGETAQTFFSVLDSVGAELQATAANGEALVDARIAVGLDAAEQATTTDKPASELSAELLALMGVPVAITPPAALPPPTKAVDSSALSGVTQIAQTAITQTGRSSLPVTDKSQPAAAPDASMLTELSATESPANATAASTQLAAGMDATQATADTVTQRWPSQWRQAMVASGRVTNDELTQSLSLEARTAANNVATEIATNQAATQLAARAANQATDQATLTDSPTNVEVTADAQLQARDGLVAMPENAALLAQLSGQRQYEVEIAQDDAQATAAVSGASLSAAAPSNNTTQLATDMQAFPVNTRHQLHASIDSSHWANELGNKLVMLASQHTQSATLYMTPADLGPVQVRIETQSDQASVWFTADHPDTRSALEQSLPKLREMFSAQGMSLTDAGVFGDRSQQQQANTRPSYFASNIVMDDETLADTSTVRALSLSLVDAYV